IGVKLFLHALHENELGFINGGEPVGVPTVSTPLSLIVILSVLIVTVIASLASPKGRAVALAADPEAAKDGDDGGHAGPGGGSDHTGTDDSGQQHSEAAPGDADAGDRR